MDIPNPSVLRDNGIPCPAGSEVGELLRSRDWSTSPLGPPAGWPQPLRTIVGLMLNSKFPMFLAWGEELGFLYNDAYVAVLGAKHPRALGRPFHEIWSEIWDDISPLIDGALAGESSWLEDMPLTMNRYGFDEPTWFTFSYSPAYGEDGTIAGMFCSCTETTRKVLAERENKAQRERLVRMFQQAPGFMAMLSGPDHVFELANAAYTDLVGPRDYIGRPVREVLPELEGQGLFEALDEAYATGEAFAARGLPVTLQRSASCAAEQHYLDFVYQPITGSDGSISGIFVEGYDVTERKIAADHQRLLVDELNHRVKNMLAIVQGIAAQTFKGDAATPEARSAFERRLAALAATHNLLTRQNWEPVSITDVVNEALEPFRAGQDQIKSEGPDLKIAPKTAITLALAINELATNAAKHGALTVPEGSVELLWSEVSEDTGMRLKLRWKERGGPAVKEPSHRGFGTRMIERGLSAELGGQVRIDFEPDGVACSVDAPLPNPAA
jgi:two-component sensor histidine kinase